ncbi:ABC transporter permease (plasmid) [Pseudoalteromonas sp. T1lg65]|uniref:ABC transporter permease n=1 Tax=Pseudoalteromonas sp. T1lg65 TaxID=2077101 RepID=UPI003F793088
MKYLDLFSDAIVQLQQHKLRTLLTLLGMIFGVGAVIAMLNIGEGAEREALKMIDSMGINNIIVEAKDIEEDDLKEQRKHSRGLSLLDGRVVVDALPQIDSFAAERHIDTYQIYSQYQRYDGEAVGVTANYFSLSHFDLAEGRALNQSDSDDFKQVALLGANTAAQLFPLGNAVGNRIKINHLWFDVVGIMRAPNLSKKEFQGVELGGEQSRIFVPLSTAINRFDKALLDPEVTQLKLSVSKPYSPIEVSKVVNHVLSSRHGEVDDYRITIPAALLAQQKQTQAIFNIVMSCVAGISLLVGGIGIMNIMLATVLERTKEIGLLRAIGATQKNIQVQFITESFTISILGGLLGVVFGLLLSEVIAFYSEWAVSWSLNAIILSFSICALVGLTFGVYPAIKASKLDPIEALQSD